MFRFFLMMAIGTAIPLMAVSLAGKWTGTIETNGSRVPVFLTIDQQEGRITGSVATGNGAKPAAIESAELHDDNFAFDVHDNAGRIVKFRLELTGSGLNGESTVGGQTSKV